MITNFRAVDIREKIFEHGRCVARYHDLNELKEYCAGQVGTLWDEKNRLLEEHAE